MKFSSAIVNLVALAAIVGTAESYEHNFSVSRRTSKATKEPKDTKEPKEPKEPKAPKTGVPTSGPTAGPTSEPTSGPTAGPTAEPTSMPTMAPEPECAGQLIFMGMTATNLIGSNTMTYIQAVNAAPAGCGLATITSESDRARAFEAKPGFDEYWMGVFKDYEAVVADGRVGGSVVADNLRNGWMNSDGSDLYEQGNDASDTPMGPWKDNNFPNNGTNEAKTNTVWQNQGLIDAAPTQGADGAIFKCCIAPTRFGQPVEDMM